MSNIYFKTFTYMFFMMFFLSITPITPFISIGSSMMGSIPDGIISYRYSWAYGIPIPSIFDIKLLPDIKKDGYLIRFDNPKRGNFVGIESEDELQNYGKRIVAIPGDILFVKNGDFYLHFKEGNQYIEENFAKFETVHMNNKTFVKNPHTKYYEGIHRNKSKDSRANSFDAPTKLRKDTYYVLGDNRDHSYDSRDFGVVEIGEIKGKNSSYYVKLPIFIRDGIKFINNINEKIRYFLRRNIFKIIR